MSEWKRIKYKLTKLKKKKQKSKAATYLSSSQTETKRRENLNIPSGNISLFITNREVTKQAQLHKATSTLHSHEQVAHNQAMPPPPLYTLLWRAAMTLPSPCLTAPAVHPVTNILK